MFSYLPDTDRLTEMLEKQSPRQSPKFPKKSTPRQSPLRKSPLRKSLPKQSPVKEDPDKQLKDFIQKLFDKYDITAKDEMGAHREKIIETIIKKHKIDVNKAAKLVDDMTVDLF
jgi:polyhydroxyalkanoate synthesis regulator phasin